MKSLITFALAVGVVASVHAQQSASQDHSSHQAAQSSASATALKSEGEVRRVDLEQGKVTLRHGPLVNLDMPAMTMVFTATDKKMLEGVKQGDKVRFNADKRDGAFVVTGLEVMR